MYTRYIPGSYSTEVLIARLTLGAFFAIAFCSLLYIGGYQRTRVAKPLIDLLTMLPATTSFSTSFPFYIAHVLLQVLVRLEEVPVTGLFSLHVP